MNTPQHWHWPRILGLLALILAAALLAAATVSCSTAPDPRDPPVYRPTQRVEYPAPRE